MDINVIILVFIFKNLKLREFLFMIEILFYVLDYMLREFKRYWIIIEEKVRKRGIIEFELVYFREEFLGRIIFYLFFEYCGFINEVY